MTHHIISFRKLFISLGCLFLYMMGLFANPITTEQATTVGLAFLANKSMSHTLRSTNQLDLVYSVQTTRMDAGKQAQQSALIYVFNTDTDGYIIVSGDTRANPILGYSDASIFDPENIPKNLRKWIEGYVGEIRHAIEHDVEAPDEVQRLWSTYLGGNVAASDKQTSTVTPLVQAKWNQSPHYNALCPDQSVAGCVAIAMAMVMKYWNHPAQGEGFHSYDHQTYGTLSANFGATTYQWSSMPNRVTSPNTAVATLIYHLGVSVEMNYSRNSSGAYVISSRSPIEHCAEFALKTYFGYKNSLEGIRKFDYTHAAWVNLLKNELNAARPIIYAGFGSGGGSGHAFVCDGYDSNDFFHFNWGWGGAYDGYFALNALTPTGTGIGGGEGGYSSGQQAIIGIEPVVQTAQSANIIMYDHIKPSVNEITYRRPFEIKTNVANSGNGDFHGDFCAAVFDDEFIFIDFVEILYDYSLRAGYTYTNGLTFKNEALFTMLPGEYYMAVFHRPTDGNWTIVSDHDDFSNMISIKVVNPSDIELHTPISVSPGNVVTQGEPMSVNFNLKNDGSGTFTGRYAVALYDLDGKHAQSIGGNIRETNGLPPNYVYASPYLTFSTESVDVAPGTYLLAVMHYPDNVGWYLTGSTYHQNPVKVIAQASALQADMYEPNDDFDEAYLLPVTFTNNTAKVKTTGSNLHSVDDIDVYKINLPTGYNYTINARAHDSYNSGDGNTYTADVLFFYTKDMYTWSDVYDDIMANDIVMDNGGSLYFIVASYFDGETGTYLLEINIQRNQATDVTWVEQEEGLAIYPNPAKNHLTIEIDRPSNMLKHIHLINMSGQILDTWVINDHVVKLQKELNQYTKGMYFLQLQFSGGIITRKIMIEK